MNHIKFKVKSIDQFWPKRFFFLRPPLDGALKLNIMKLKLKVKLPAIFHFCVYGG